MQRDSNSIAERLKQWELTLNIETCKVLSLGAKNNCKWKYMQGSSKLSHSQAEQDLDVLIDKYLSFDDHIHSAVADANRILAILRMSFQASGHGQLYVFIQKDGSEHSVI